MEHGASTSAAAEVRMSLVRGDVLFRLQRAIGLTPAEGLGVGRRALALSALAWLPIVAWAAFPGRVFPGAVAEPLLEHFGIHVRCLVAIPLLVVAEAMAHGVTTWLVPYFVDSGLVENGTRPAFLDAVRSVIVLRDSSRPWVLIGALVLSWTVVRPVV